VSVEDHFRQAYKEGSTPWDIDKPDFNLVQTVTTLPIAPYRALEVGCGTGDNAIWLVQHGFDVVGVGMPGSALLNRGANRRSSRSRRVNSTVAAWRRSGEPSTVTNRGVIVRRIVDNKECHASGL
jgi:SAM-dependent methyltransferase